MTEWNDYETTKPAKAGRYLVSGYDGINVRIVIMRWNDINNRWVQTGVLAHITVTHWMPLPAPPDGVTI